MVAGRRGLCRALASLALGAMVFGAGGPADASEKQQELIDRAKLAVDSLRANDDIGPAVNGLLANAKAVVIVPSLLKAGLIIGGEGGNGVLLTKLEDGSWSAPAFVEMAAASIGLQIGGSQSQVMFVVVTDKGLDAIVKNNVKFGAGIGVAAGPVGGNVQASTTTAVGADVYTYALSKGAFVGAAFDGSSITSKGEWNQAYYGAALDTEGVVGDAVHIGEGSEGLRKALAE